MRMVTMASWLGAVVVLAAAVGCAQEEVPGGAPTGSSGEGGDAVGGTTATSSGSTGSAGTGGAPPECIDPAVDCDPVPNECQVAVCQGAACALENVARNQACASSGGKICDGGGLCIDPDWASWPMPNGAVDAAAGAPNEMDYTDHGDGTVDDKVTSLMWQKAVDAGSYNQQAAFVHCAGVDLADYTDWRVPTHIELVSLLDYGVAPAGPTIRGDVFPSTPSAFFGSSTSGADWFVNFTDGLVSFSDGSGHRIRCVR